MMGIAFNSLDAKRSYFVRLSLTAEKKTGLK